MNWEDDFENSVLQQPSAVWRWNKYGTYCKRMRFKDFIAAYNSNQKQNLEQTKGVHPVLPADYTWDLNVMLLLLLWKWMMEVHWTVIRVVLGSTYAQEELS